MAKRQTNIIRAKVRTGAGTALLHTGLAISEAGMELMMYKKLWLVEVNPVENKVRVNLESEALTSNLETFAAGKQAGYQFVSIHIDEPSAKEIEHRIRTRFRDEAGTRLAFDIRLRKKK